MICKNCGTEIANQALTCYECGTVTSESELRPSDTRRTTSFPYVPFVLGLVFFVVAGFFMNQMVEGEPPSLLVWLMLGVAGVLLAWRLRLRE